MFSKVGPKGQITITKEVRDALEVRPGCHAFQIVEEGRLVVYFVPPPHNRSLAGVLAGPGPDPCPTQEAYNRAREAAWAEVMREKYGTPDQTKGPGE